MNLSLTGDLEIVRAEMERRYGIDRHRRPGPESSLAIIGRAHERARKRDRGLRQGR